MKCFDIERYSSLECWNPEETRNLLKELVRLSIIVKKENRYTVNL